MMLTSTPPRPSYPPPDWRSSPDRGGAFHPSHLTRTDGNGEKEQPRRPSFSFLRRQRTSEPHPAARNASASGRSISARTISGVSIAGRKAGNKQKEEQEELLRQQKEAAALSKQPPRLPPHPPLPKINTFGVDASRPGSVAIVPSRVDGDSRRPSEIYGRPPVEYRMVTSPPYNVPPVPPIPDSSPADLYARTESMTNRGRYSYASSAVSTMTLNTLNSPRRVRRRKDPTPFK